MIEQEKFIEVAKKKAIIKQLENEVSSIEQELKRTFSSDVMSFFISKGYELEKLATYRSDLRFKNLRQINEKSTFTNGYEPTYKIAGKNYLTVKFQWKLSKNSTHSQIYWYPEKQTLEDFYKRRLKKTLVLPIKVERKNKLTKIQNENL